jgi:hypothetical protein
MRCVSRLARRNSLDSEKRRRLQKVVPTINSLVRATRATRAFADSATAQEILSAYEESKEKGK